MSNTIFGKCDEFPAMLWDCVDCHPYKIACASLASLKNMCIIVQFHVLY